MKIVIRNIILICAGAVVFLILMTMVGRTKRSVEIESNLSSVVEETVENMAVNPKYTIDNVYEYVADMTQYLADVLEADSDIKIEVEKADKERGLLAVKVTERFLHPNGKVGTVSDSRVVILNKLEEPVIPKFTVKFYLSKEEMVADGGCYKTYYLQEGDMISAPVAPEKDGAVFDGWRDVNEYIADFSVPVTQDVIYYAVWN